MIYLVSLFQVRAADVCAFVDAFRKGGTWQELHRSLPGYIHSDLLVSSASPTCFLLLQFFQSEVAALSAQRNSEVFSFRAFAPDSRSQSRRTRSVSLPESRGAHLAFSFQPCTAVCRVNAGASRPLRPISFRRMSCF